MVLTLGMSMPFSMIVVASRRSYSPAVKACMRRDSSRSSSWPWPTVMRRPGTRSRRKVDHFLDRLDPVVDVVDLAAALELVLDRLAHHFLRERQDGGLHRHAVLGRRLDHRQVAHSGERELQRARHRRRGHRQHVDLLLPLLEPLFLRHAETLLLVDHQERQARQLDVLRQQRGGCRSGCRPCLAPASPSPI